MDSFEAVDDAALARAVDASMDGVAVLDDDGEYRYVNDAYAEMHGVENPERMVGWSWQRLYGDDQAERLETTVMPLLSMDGSWRGEAEGRRIDGERFHQELSLSTLDDGGAVCVVRDISTRHETRTMRRERRERLATILENMPVVLFVLDSEGTYTLLEGRALSSIPLEPASTLGESAADVLPPDSEIPSDIERALSGERFSTVQSFGPRQFETVYNPVFDGDDVTQVIGVALDVTEREQFRDRLTELHEATRRLAYANSEAEVIAHVVDTVEEVIDRSLVAYWRVDDEGMSEELQPVAMSDDARELIGGEATAVEPGTVEMDAFESGETRVVDDYGALTDPKGSDAPLGTVLLVPVGEHGLLSVATTDVEEVPSNDRRLLEVLTGNAAAALDSAARERQIAEQSDRTDFLNSLLRHDLINGLQVVQARLDATVDHIPAEYTSEVEYARDWCGEAMEFIEKTRAVLNAIANDDHALEPVDVAGVVSEEAANVRDRYPEATVDVETPGDPAVVAGDEMVSEVVGNVVTNAVTHHDGVDPWVGVEVARDDEAVTVTVEDDGPGIATDTVGDIFDRGATTDPDGGSGFGLYFVDVMMDKYGGEVRAWNREEQGAAFELTFERA